MKLYVVAQKGNLFRAGLIDGTITFKTNTMSLSSIQFIPYTNINSKKQIKDLADFVPFFSWMKQALLNIFGEQLPYDQDFNENCCEKNPVSSNWFYKDNIFTDLPYDADTICHTILGFARIDRLWINNKSVLIC